LTSDSVSAYFSFDFPDTTVFFIAVSRPENLAVTDFLVLLLLMAASSSTFSLLLASTSSASFSSFAPSAASADSVSLLSQIKMMSMKGGSLGVEELWTE